MQDARYMMHDAGFRMARGNEGKESDGEEIASQEPVLSHPKCSQ
ncbi:MAG: hypothetical protein WBD99_07030 [Thermodesulfobacteriota bacterium]